MPPSRLFFLRIRALQHSHSQRAAADSSPAISQASLLQLRPWQPRVPQEDAKAAFFVGESRSSKGEFPPSLAEHLSTLVPSMEVVGSTGAYLDLSGCERLYPDSTEFLRGIASYAGKLQLGSLSAGEGSSRLVARLAAAVAPEGRWWSVAQPKAFLAPFPLDCVADDHPVLVRALERMGLRTLGEVAAMPSPLLRQALGDDALLLWREARGEGRRSLRGPATPQRLRERHDFEQSQSDPELVASVLTVLADRLAVSLRASGLAAGKVELHARFHGGARLQRQRTLHPPQSSLSALREKARELWTGAEERRTGVITCELRAELLRPTPEESLRFDFDRAQNDLAPFITKVRDRFGDDALQWSPELWMDQEKRSP